MHLYVAPMDTVVVDFAADGRIKCQNEDWTLPSMQEQRAVMYAAREQIALLTELVERLEALSAPGRR